MKLHLADERMILALMGPTPHQRRAISWWLLKNFNSVTETPGYDHAYPDKSALSTEILAQFMAQLETLEMVYFALREKVLRPEQSFTECYLSIHIKEPAPGRTAGAWCAPTMLAQLESMTVERFQAELGMPRFEDLKWASCGEPMHKDKGGREAYEAHVKELIQWMRQAVENKTHYALHRAFITMKHGFCVITLPDFPDIHFIQSTQPLDSTTCIAETAMFDNRPEALVEIDDQTRIVGELIRNLLKLYVGRSPANSCAKCGSDQEPCKERDETPAS